MKGYIILHYFNLIKKSPGNPQLVKKQAYNNGMFDLTGLTFTN